MAISQVEIEADEEKTTRSRRRDRVEIQSRWIELSCFSHTLGRGWCSLENQAEIGLRVAAHRPPTMPRLANAGSALGCMHARVDARLVLRGRGPYPNDLDYLQARAQLVWRCVRCALIIAALSSMIKKTLSYVFLRKSSFEGRIAQKRDFFNLGKSGSAAVRHNNVSVKV
eukprot:6176503-Pleurochrysis_carterae.AAC.1